jgi:hypothetical protein
MEDDEGTMRGELIGRTTIWRRPRFGIISCKVATRALKIWAPAPLCMFAWSFRPTSSSSASRRPSHTEALVADST